MKYYIIAGEASGDTHASNLMKAIKVNDKAAEFRAWGGDKMKAQGAPLVKHYHALAFMGIKEVLLNLRTILKNIAFCKKDLVAYDPDVLILVDYPGFNLKIAKFAHQKGIKTVYYISPQIWAWHRSRVYQIKKTVDLMLVILPFEKDFYNRYHHPVTYVGNPLLDELEEKSFADRQAFLQTNQLTDKPLIAILPGSRTQEIKAILPTMVSMADLFPAYQFVIAGASIEKKELYKGAGKIAVVYYQMHDLLANAEAAIVTSGTAVLETALIGTPEVVCYHTSRITYEVAKRVVKVKYISLVNLIMEKPVVTELIQNEFNKKNLQNELHALLFDSKKRATLKADYRALRHKLGNKGASQRAADAIQHFLTKGL